ncbi:isochorismatase family protein [Bifidobacterium sp. ESL0745]|uniref:isochorismatase family protein n=1 Tax=Bifidobacterium sp. ESL0745 TaxID=2983226 RepID=UPI0023F71E27|nr:isochorismatase family protein [Bifidobacterium sp. ESL0745]MDF7664824.1 isochorismatase family protein [Bifidobacterium sp. ESL0745]
MSRPALLVIDAQNDYLPGGMFPLANMDKKVERMLAGIEKAKKQGAPVILVQHIADPSVGMAPFFNEGTEGAKIIPEIRAAAPDAPVVIKHYADAFEGTDLLGVLQGLDVNELIIEGMMTQNCVTFTALARPADDFDKVTVLTDASTTATEILHKIAIMALSTRVDLGTVDEIMGE